MAVDEAKRSEAAAKREEDAAKRADDMAAQAAKMQEENAKLITALANQPLGCTAGGTTGWSATG